MDKTAAELTPEEKHAISHRGQAVREFMEKIQGYLN
jgi:XTP/dITP diphosphohydrolase